MRILITMFGAFLILGIFIVPAFTLGTDTGGAFGIAFSLFVLGFFFLSLGKIIEVLEQIRDKLSFSDEEEEDEMEEVASS